ncbi:protein of unknown function [Tenacibaculum sp. MAR_2009_124]|uniref:DUF4136 domain-containing protein n=1 Tax=Tenacibaculum sp. MAR_2009_124 TaxID=1250059 RepID=UPI0008984746|nr:DUF4136 domain-containing protein [Tenacibaculum sp. MAR_2009_124]SEB75909.1 protein of unknown function [Tenacibaculum sp. MAR_2009_124]
MKKLIYLTLLLVLTISCTVNRTNYDYDSYTDFTKYKTYNFFNDVGKGLNELDVNRVQNIIARQLNLQGMVYSENPDVFVNFVSEKWDVNNNTTIGLGMGGDNVGIGISGISLGDGDIKQNITIDLVDAGSNKLVWQGSVLSQISPNLSPSAKKKHFGIAIKKVFRKYPPKR